MDVAPEERKQMLEAWENKFSEEEREAMIDYALFSPEHVIMAHTRSNGLKLPQFSLMELPPEDLMARLPETFQHLVFFGSQLRDMPLFAIDSEMLIGAVNSMLESGIDLGEVDLPPLPFPQLAFETTPEAVWAGEGTDVNDISGCIVEQIEEGQEWFLGMLVGDGEDFRMIGMLVRPGRQCKIVGVEDARWTTFQPGSLPDICIQAMHLVTASNVEHVPLPRPVRREFERKAKRKHPQTFTIRIGKSVQYERDEDDGLKRAGPSVRFMVRGHWRHYTSGKKTWVRPYIKGPAGAPWRAPANPVRLLTSRPQ